MTTVRVRLRGRDLIPLRAYARANGNIGLSTAMKELMWAGFRQEADTTDIRLLREVMKHQQQDRETLRLLLNLSMQLATIARVFGQQQNAKLLQVALQSAQQAIHDVAARPEAAASVKLK
jgi:hypothetical protein